MEADFALADSTVCILGLGLMGASLALALRGHCRTLIGSDPDAGTLELACCRNILDRAVQDPKEALSGADVVILAAPVPAIVSLLGQLPSLTAAPCIVLDIGSAKEMIVAAMEGLPERFDPIGGHPLCGKENLSISNADSRLYEAAPFLLTPLKRTGVRAFSASHQIIDAIGARAVVVDAATHDRNLAHTSHLPFLLSSALALAVPTELSGFVGPGFRSASRLAGTPASMMLGVLRSNRANVLQALHTLQNNLSEIETALSLEDFARLEELLDEARGKYEELAQ